MRKGIPHEADRVLHSICMEKSHEVALQGIPGSASTQLDIRKIADRVIDYALDSGTSPGVIEVVFADQPWKGLTELYLQCPLTVTFRNFIPEKDIDQNTLLIKHVLVVTNWSNNIKLFKATIESEPVHLMLYSAVKKANI